jgi:hypothetical protein
VLGRLFARSKKGSSAKSGRARFVFGAAIGVAVSVALFESVDIALANFMLTTAFDAMMS